MAKRLCGRIGSFFSDLPCKVLDRFSPPGLLSAKKLGLQVREHILGRRWVPSGCTPRAAHPVGKWPRISKGAESKRIMDGF